MTKCFFFPKPNKDALMRFYCFPYAGGDVHSFTNLVAQIDKRVEMVFVQYPGRGKRYSDPLYTEMNCLSEEIVEAFLDQPEMPSIFFGHSLGSRVAYDVARKLKERHKIELNYFIASAGKAPNFPMDKSETEKMSDNELIQKLRVFGGASEVVLNDREMLDYFLPIIRSDLILNDRYFREASNDKLFCRASVFIGKNDTIVNEGHIAQWKEHFVYPLHIKTLPGDHFFLHKNSNSTVKELNKIIGEAFLLAA